MKRKDFEKMEYEGRIEEDELFDGLCQKVKRRRSICKKILKVAMSIYVISFTAFVGQVIYSCVLNSKMKGSDKTAEEFVEKNNRLNLAEAITGGIAIPSFLATTFSAAVEIDTYVDEKKLKMLANNKQQKERYEVHFPEMDNKHLT